MPVETERHITRQSVRSRPDALFVFGDNLERRGRGGQAAEMRGEPNAVGIPTKRAPRRDESAYFTDDDYSTAVAAMRLDMIRLGEHVKQGGVVVIPADGIGTGLAELPTRAPRIHAYIQRCFEKLRGI
ncbi:hypothetical protein ACJ41P_10680 [Azospirillum argentinense]|uniref:DUF7831 domain-containing protein n=1 Tax=Azospirillum argentinense TaxID=2970906 RepID=A0ABW8V511_9PROT